MAEHGAKAPARRLPAQTKMNFLSALSLVATSAPADFEPALLIPIVAIVGGLSIPILAIFLDYRKKQLQARIIEKGIEQGLSTEEIAELIEQYGGEKEEGKEKCNRRRHPFRSGLVLMAIGMAFYLAENSNLVGGPYLPWDRFPMGGSFIAYLLMGLGAANLISDLLNLGRFKDSN